MVLYTYTVDVPEGCGMRSHSFYKLKTLQDDYVERRGRPPKSDDDIEIPDKNLPFNSKEKQRYKNRLYYIRKKNGLVNNIKKDILTKNQNL